MHQPCSASSEETLPTSPPMPSSSTNHNSLPISPPLGSADVQSSAANVLIKIWHGEECMNHLRSKARYNPSPLQDRSLFIQWCRETNARLHEDAEYRLKVRQRNIRFQHKEELSNLQHQADEALLEWKNHSAYARTQTVLREIEGKAKALKNMEKYLQIDVSTIEKDAEREKVLRTQQVYSVCEEELHHLKDELLALQNIPEYQDTVRTQEDLQKFMSSLELDQIKVAISSTQKDRGGKRSERGKSFEDQSTDAVKVSRLPPNLIRMIDPSTSPFKNKVYPFCRGRREYRSCAKHHLWYCQFRWKSRGI